MHQEPAFLKRRRIPKIPELMVEISWMMALSIWRVAEPGPAFRPSRLDLPMSHRAPTPIAGSTHRRTVRSPRPDHLPGGADRTVTAHGPIISEIVAKRSRSLFIGCFANHQDT